MLLCNRKLTFTSDPGENRDQKHILCKNCSETGQDINAEKYATYICVADLTFVNINVALFNPFGQFILLNKTLTLTLSIRYPSILVGSNFDTFS